MLLEYLSENLILDKKFIIAVARSANMRYKSFTIPKKTGGNRIIYHPARELKTLQKAIHDYILEDFPIHQCAMAYNKESSILKNAEVHKNSKYMMRLDFKDFFESIRKSDIECFLQNNTQLKVKGWTDIDTDLFTSIVCYKGGLTIGSVTSPLLSNAICYSLDIDIFNLCNPKNICYSRYADDMFFSTNEPNQLFDLSKDILRIIRSQLYPKNLWLNFNKTRHSSRKNKMAITGVIITNDKKVSLGYKNKRKVRSLIFKWSDLKLEEKKYLQGYLSYCYSIEPEFINNLCLKYGAQRIRDIQIFN